MKNIAHKKSGNHLPIPILKIEYYTLYAIAKHFFSHQPYFLMYIAYKTIHPLPQSIKLPKRVNYHLLISYESISFTNADTILLSALPANALFAAPITLPISAGEVAPKLAIISFNATRISSSLII